MVTTVFLNGGKLFMFRCTCIQSANIKMRRNLKTVKLISYFCGNQSAQAMSLYTKRGVSAQKEEVHQAIKKLDKGLYEYAFCKMYPDYIGNDDAFINIMHADGAGTKSILAYLYWKET